MRGGDLPAERLADFVRQRLHPLAGARLAALRDVIAAVEGVILQNMGNILAQERNVISVCSKIAAKSFRHNLYNSFIILLLFLTKIINRDITSFIVIVLTVKTYDFYVLGLPPLFIVLRMRSDHVTDSV